MNFFEIAPGILVYKNAYNDAKNIIEEVESLVKEGYLFWEDGHVKNENGNQVSKSERDTKVIAIPYSNLPINMLTALASDNKSKIAISLKLKSFFKPLEDNYFSQYGISFKDHDAFQILKYGIGQKFVNHIDDHTDFHRRVSMVYYINDDYEGGEINFPRFGISYKPNANEMLIFPSTYVYNHSVNPVTSGTRYAIVSWIK